MPSGLGIGEAPTCCDDRRVVAQERDRKSTRGGVLGAVCDQGTAAPVVLASRHSLATRSPRVPPTAPTARRFRLLLCCAQPAAPEVHGTV